MYLWCSDGLGSPSASNLSRASGNEFFGNKQRAETLGSLADDEFVVDDGEDSEYSRESHKSRRFKSLVSDKREQASRVGDNQNSYLEHILLINEPKLSSF